MSENPYRPVKARIEKVITETSNIKTFILKPEEKVSFLSGQFMQVTVPGMGEAPFTPSSDPHVSDSIEFTIMRTGNVTEKLHGMKEGEFIGIRGPYGKPYPLQTFHGKDIYIVGGGVGLAPLRSFFSRCPMNLIILIKLKFGSARARRATFLTIMRSKTGKNGKRRISSSLWTHLSPDGREMWDWSRQSSRTRT